VDLDTRDFLTDRDELLTRPFNYFAMCVVYLEKDGRPVPPTPGSAEIAYHKARAGCSAVPVEMRRQSLAWLEAWRDEQP
jgi:hypothetical protein